MMRPRVLFGLCAAGTARALLAPAVARRAAPLHVIETDSDTEKEIFSETTSISGALAELWQVLANPPPPGDFRAMYFPQCEGLKRPQTFQALFEHLEVCKDSSQRAPAWKSNFGRPTPSTRRCPRLDGTGWFPHRNFGAHIHAMPGVHPRRILVPCFIQGAHHVYRP